MARNPCQSCTPETGRTLTCHDCCEKYRAYVQMLQAAKPSQSERDAAEVTFRGQCKSMKQRGTRKPAQR